MKFLNPAVYCFALGHFSVDWAQGAIPALLPYFIEHYGFTYKAAGLLVFSIVLLSSILQPIFGYYADKVSKPWFVSVGPILCGISISLMGFGETYAALFAAALICGVGCAIYHPEGALMVNRVGGEQKGKAMGLFSVGGNLGFAAGPMLAGICAYTWGIHSLIIFGILNTAFAALIHWQMQKVLREAKEQKKSWITPGGEKGAENDWPSFGKLSVCIMARSFGFTLSNTFIPLLWISAFAASASEGTNALSFLFGFGAVCTFCGGLLSDKVGYHFVIRAAFCLMAPTYFLLTHTDNVMLAWILLIPAAMSVFSAYSPMVILGQTYLAKNAGFASGITLGLSTTLGGIFAPVVGWAADTWGLSFALQILWIVGLLGAIFAFTLKIQKKKPV